MKHNGSWLGLIFVPVAAHAADTAELEEVVVTAFGSLLSLGDVERVDVLRGPQGTLFGILTGQPGMPRNVLVSLRYVF